MALRLIFESWFLLTNEADVHSNLSQAAVELRQAVRTWRQQNLPANKK